MADEPAGHPIRCTNCGRFLGYIDIVEGEIILFCKNCKGWTAYMAGREKSLLTPEGLIEMLNERAGTKKERRALT